MTAMDLKPMRPSIRHRRPVRQPNRFIVPIFIVGVIAVLLQIYWMQHNWREMTRRHDAVVFDEEFFELWQAKFLTHYECEYCQGSGLLDDPDAPGERMLCPICWGVGYHATRRHAEGDRMCLACGGMGRHYDDDDDEEAVFCSRCEGRGIVEFGD